MHLEYAEMEKLMNTTKVKNEDGMVGEGVGFERIRRITGYLVGTIDRFNDAKASEVHDRVKHGLSGSSKGGHHEREER